MSTSEITRLREKRQREREGGASATKDRLEPLGGRAIWRGHEQRVATHTETDHQQREDEGERESKLGGEQIGGKQMNNVSREQTTTECDVDGGYRYCRDQMCTDMPG